MKNKLRPFDEGKARNLIIQLRQSCKDARTLADELEQVLTSGEISSKVQVHLVTWCADKDDNLKKGREIARKISELLFGKIIDEYD